MSKHSTVIGIVYSCIIRHVDTVNQAAVPPQSSLSSSPSSSSLSSSLSHSSPPPSPSPPTSASILAQTVADNGGNSNNNGQGRRLTIKFPHSLKNHLNKTTNLFNNHHNNSSNNNNNNGNVSNSPSNNTTVVTDATPTTTTTSAIDNLNNNNNSSHSIGGSEVFNIAFVSEYTSHSQASQQPLFHETLLSLISKIAKHNRGNLQKRTLTQTIYHFHYKFNNSYYYCCVSKADFPLRIVYSYLDDVETQFLRCREIMEYDAKATRDLLKTRMAHFNNLENDVCAPLCTALIYLSNIILTLTICLISRRK